MRSLIESRSFERFITAVIILNAATLGLETYSWSSSSFTAFLFLIDKAFLAIFSIEIVLKLWVYRTAFFRDPWRVFDLTIVAIALLPAAGPFSVMRSLRVLRALRMISVVPSLKRVVNGLLMAIPGLGAVATIMALIFYVGAVMATKLFGASFPQWFGSLAASAYTLFQIMTLESWSMGIVRPVLEQYPYAWLFFLPFILITTFTMLNLFIAVIVNAMQAETEQAAETRAKSGEDDRRHILATLETLQTSIDGLSQRVESLKNR